VARPDFGKGSPRDRIASDGRGYSEYARLMFDMIALASNRQHRSVSHIPRSEGDDGKAYKYLTNSRWTCTHSPQRPGRTTRSRCGARFDALYLAEWAYFLGKLKSVKEGNGTLLDNTMATWATTNGGPNAHDSKMLPLILCGKATGPQTPRAPREDDMQVANVWQTS